MSDGVDNIPGADSRCVDISVDEASVAADGSLTEIAVTQRRTPRSWIWEYNFGSKESRDGVLYLCCKVGKCKWAYPSDGSTGNLSRHLENRHNINKRNVEARANNHAVGTLDSFINEGQLNWNRPFTEVTAKLWRRALVHFIVTSQLPFFSREEQSLSGTFAPYSISPLFHHCGTCQRGYAKARRHSDVPSEEASNPEGAASSGIAIFHC